MPFYEAADHAQQLDHTRAVPELMDRVRRCTGEMFQPTRLKGRTVNTLVPHRRHRPRTLSLRTLCVPVVVLLLSSSLYPSRIQPCGIHPLALCPHPRLRPPPRRVHFSFRLIFSGIRYIPSAMYTSSARNDVHGYCVTRVKREHLSCARRNLTGTCVPARTRRSFGNDRDDKYDRYNDVYRRV